MQTSLSCGSTPDLRLASRVVSVGGWRLPVPPGRPEFYAELTSWPRIINLSFGELVTSRELSAACREHQGEPREGQPHGRQPAPAHSVLSEALLAADGAGGRTRQWRLLHGDVEFGQKLRKRVTDMCDNVSSILCLRGLIPEPFLEVR